MKLFRTTCLLIGKPNAKQENLILQMLWQDEEKLSDTMRTYYQLKNRAENVGSGQPASPLEFCP